MSGKPPTYMDNPNFNVILVGNSAVGKTSVCLKYKDPTQILTHFPTVGVDFETKVITLDDTQIKMRIWDTAGQERFRAIVDSYYKKAHAVVIMYDMTNTESFQAISEKWRPSVDSLADPKVVKILVANKSDLSKSRTVTTKDGKTLAHNMGAVYFETSALDGSGINDAFLHVARSLITMIVRPESQHATIKLTSVPTASGSWACCYWS